MTFDARHSVDQGLNHLASRLEPIISARLAPDLGGLPWTAILTELDKAHGKPPKVYAATDLQAQLKIITERLGNLAFPFDDNTRLVSTLGGELRIVRNRWAHNDELDTLDAWRTHDFVVRLLDHFGDVDGVGNARALREEAFDALAAEKGVAVHATVREPEPEPVAVAAPSAPVEVVVPDPSVLVRTHTAGTPTIGSARGMFEPWTVVLVGDVSVLDDLPKKVAKEKVRAVATEIVDFEGPIHMDRLAQLTAASFGVRRLWPAREKKLTYQIRRANLVVDEDKFVWPSDLDPAEWSEFRPNDSSADRPFTEISPVEIANAARFIRAKQPGIGDSDLDVAVLQTFGRKRRTKQIVAHLARANALFAGGTK